MRASSVPLFEAGTQLVVPQSQTWRSLILRLRPELAREGKRRSYPGFIKIYRKIDWAVQPIYCKLGTKDTSEGNCVVGIAGESVRIFALKKRMRMPDPREQ